MINYSIDGDIRQKVFKRTFFCTIIFCAFFASSIQALLEFIEAGLSHFSVQMGILHFLSLSPMDLVTPFALFGVFSWAFDRWLWRTKWVLKLTEVPDLNGVWKGTLTSSWIDPDTGHPKEIDMTLIIEQTWSKMKCEGRFKESHSDATVISLSPQGSGECQLFFAYVNQSKNMDLNLETYAGSNTLSYTKEDGQEVLWGEYYTMRTSGQTQGKIYLVKTEDAPPMSSGAA